MITTKLLVIRHGRSCIWMVAFNPSIMMGRSAFGVSDFSFGRFELSQLF